MSTARQASVVGASAADGVVQLAGLTPRRTPTGWKLVVARGVLSLPDHWVRQGRLTLRAVLKLRADGLLTPKTNSSLPVTITPITACNLRCPYCFQNKVNVTSTRVVRAIDSQVMRPRTLDAVEKFIRDRMLLMERTRVELLLFGGEPLLRPDLCAEVVGRFSQEQVGPVGLVTNGALLSPWAVDVLADAAEWNVQISLDGAKEDHDLLRSRRNGGTYEDIVDNLARAQGETRWDWHIRINCTSGNVVRIPFLLDDLASRIDVNQTNIDFSPVEDLGVGFSTSGFTERSLRQLTEAVEYAHKIGFQLAAPSSSACGFCENGNEHGVVVGPDGSLFSCWDDVGYLDRAVGNVRDGYSIQPDSKKWHKCGYAAKEDLRAVHRILNDVQERLLSSKA